MSIPGVVDEGCQDDPSVGSSGSGSMSGFPGTARGEGPLLSVACSQSFSGELARSANQARGTSLQRVAAGCCLIFLMVVSYDALFASTLNALGCSEGPRSADAISASWFAYWDFTLKVFPGVLSCAMIVAEFAFGGSILALRRMVGLSVVGLACMCIAWSVCLRPFVVLTASSNLGSSYMITAMALQAAISMLGIACVMYIPSMYAMLRYSARGARATFAFYHILPPVSTLALFTVNWIGTEAFVRMFLPYKRLISQASGGSSVVPIFAELMYVCTFTSGWVVGIRYMGSLVERWVLVPGVAAGHLDEDVAEGWVLFTDVGIDSCRWLYGRIIFANLSLLTLLGMVLKDEFYVFVQFAVRFTEANLLVYTLPRKMITKVKITSMVLRFCLLTRHVAESPIFRLLYSIGTPSTRKLERSGARLCKRPRELPKDYACMRLSDEELLIPIGQVLRTRPYTLEEIAQEVQETFGYSIASSLSAIRKPMQDSFETYQDAFAYAKTGSKHGMDALLAMCCEHLYGNVLMKDDDARTCGLLDSDMPLHAEVDVEVLIEDAGVAQAMLKAIVAPGTEWATMDMGPAWAERIAADHPDDPLIEKALRSTRAHISLEDYKAGIRPNVLVKVDTSLCDAAFDPGIKNMQRVKEKAAYKYLDSNGQPMYRRVRDISRLALLYDSPSRLRAAVKKIKKVFKVVEIENRFASPTALGWRDVTILVELLANGRRHIAELQLQLKVYALARTNAHKYYKILREELPNACKVRPEDMERIQLLILGRLSSRKLLTELDIFQEEMRKTRSTLAQPDADSKQGVLYQEGVDVHHIRSELLSSLQATVLRRYVAYSLPRVISSAALLVSRVAVPATARSYMTDMDEDQEVTAEYLLLPMGLLLVDLAEITTMLTWMLRANRRHMPTRLPPCWSRPCLVAAVLFALMGSVLNPLSSKLSVRLCDP